MERHVTIYEIYELYDNGTIYNTKTEKWLTPYIRKGTNQYYITLYNNKKIIVSSIARLVAEAFVKKPQTDKNLVVGHINLDTLDNRAENLIWLTSSSFTKQKSELGFYDDLRERRKRKVKLVNRLECIELPFNSINDAAVYLKSIKPDAPKVSTIVTALSLALKRNGTVYNWEVLAVEQEDN